MRNKLSLNSNVFPYIKVVLQANIFCLVLLRLYVRNFWSQEKRLPIATLDRMLTVLQSLYSSKIEKCFLSLATDLLLEMTSQSPDFKRNMFEYPLSECTFQVSGSLLHLTLFTSAWKMNESLLFLSPLGLSDWFKLAFQEHSDDSDVCWNPELSGTGECSISNWYCEGKA